MTCAECKDTRIYQPLIGPPERCRACFESVGRVRFDDIACSSSVYQLESERVASLVQSISNIDLGVSLSVYKLTDTQYEVSYDRPNPSTLFAALAKIRRDNLPLFLKLFPDQMIPVTILGEDK